MLRDASVNLNISDIVFFALIVYKQTFILLVIKVNYLSQYSKSFLSLFIGMKAPKGQILVRFQYKITLTESPEQNILCLYPAFRNQNFFLSIVWVHGYEKLKFFKELLEALLMGNTLTFTPLFLNIFVIIIEATLPYISQ